MPICVLFLIWARDPLYYQISLFLSFLGTFWSWFKGVIHALKMFKNTFLLKIYPKVSKKKLKLNQSVRMTMGVLTPPPTTVQWNIGWWFFDNNFYEHFLLSGIINSLRILLINTWHRTFFTIVLNKSSH